MYNSVTLIGRVGQKPELKTISSGSAVCNFSLATNKKYKSREGESVEHTEWHRLVAWGRTAEICGQYLDKGSLIMVEGELQTRKWQAADGTDRYATEIIVQRMQMLSSGRGGGAADSQGAANDTSAAAYAPAHGLSAGKDVPGFPAVR